MMNVSQYTYCCYNKKDNIKGTERDTTAVLESPPAFLSGAGASAIQGWF